MPAILIDRFIRHLGYVPKSEMDDALVGRDKIERELRHSKRDLQNQLYLRDRLEKEVGFLRELELARVRNNTATQQAVARLDAATDKLEELMENTWPAANLAALPELG